MPVRVASLSVEAPGASPLRFLRLAEGARGFWARGERWVAHSGVLAAVAAEPGPDRFAEVRRAAAERVAASGPGWPEDADPRVAGKLRFYGGFSFQDEPGASHVWIGFPAALFHLPAVELEGDAGGAARLRVRAPVPEGGDEAGVRACLEERARQLLGALAQPGPAAPATGGDRGLAGVETDRAAFERAVEQALAAIRAGRVSKVVLARTLDVSPHPSLDPVAVLARLWEANRGSHVFYFEPTPERVLLGAAPETVATLRRGVFHATAVAGSIRVGGSPEEQAALAERLLASAKDREEHRIALDDMVDRLRPLTTGVRADAAPHVLSLPAIQHLETEIRARSAEGVTVLDLLAALHPTPAVCGRPREEALALLAREEPFERGWYAGPVGWFDLEGNGVFAPALRTAVRFEGAWRLFAGAGIVEGSRPDAEWIETGIKFEPVLRALRAATES